MAQIIEEPKRQGGYGGMRGKGPKLTSAKIALRKELLSKWTIQELETLDDLLIECREDMKNSNDPKASNFFLLSTISSYFENKSVVDLHKLFTNLQITQQRLLNDYDFTKIRVLLLPNLENHKKTIFSLSLKTQKHLVKMFNKMELVNQDVYRIRARTVMEKLAKQHDLDVCQSFGDTGVQYLMDTAKVYEFIKQAIFATLATAGKTIELTDKGIRREICVTNEDVSSALQMLNWSSISREEAEVKEEELKEEEDEETTKQGMIDDPDYYDNNNSKNNKKNSKKRKESDSNNNNIISEELSIVDDSIIRRKRRGKKDRKILFRQSNNQSTTTNSTTSTTTTSDNNNNNNNRNANTYEDDGNESPLIINRSKRSTNQSRDNNISTVRTTTRPSLLKRKSHLS